MQALWNVLAVMQAGCALVLFARLIRGWFRPSRLEALAGALPATATTIIVPTLNEGRRIQPLLAGVTSQAAPVIEVLVVDSSSTDGTRDLILAAAQNDSRIRLLTDPPVPESWIGKAWAIEHARQSAKGEWILTLDADTTPKPGLAAAIVAAAEREQYDVVSLAPRFIGQSAMERWLQPALVTTLVYRFGARVSGMRPNRVMANGQCFLVRREMLEKFGGLAPVRASFAEDVSLARHLAHHGARVAFLDGSRLIDVKSYESAGEMWREWGRSIDLKDASTPIRQAVDVAFVGMVQGLPLPMLVLAAFVTMPAPLVMLNAVLFGTRAVFSAAIRGNYAVRGLAFWLSPCADPLAAIRLLISSVRRPTSWRGRRY